MSDILDVNKYTNYKNELEIRERNSMSRKSYFNKTLLERVFVSIIVDKYELDLNIDTNMITIIEVENPNICYYLSMLRGVNKSKIFIIDNYYYLDVIEIDTPYHENEYAAIPKGFGAYLVSLGINPNLIYK